ncbi:hypothetical protein LCGC14_1164540 [marine sediment metagenome]|uniref:Uncharacterized protein n=1 Tax=marine sediment metagenome TaxID=412755 RepID=A0A0F9LWQ5_9ZZZZ|nr:MAG: hypothetical protein Lokiarch_16920 [Candidatus Lokiarchaeum sp. GC14_75]
MEPKEGLKYENKLENEIKECLESKGYKIGGPTSFTTIDNVFGEFRVQTKEIGFIIHIKAVKRISL